MYGNIKSIKKSRDGIKIMGYGIDKNTKTIEYKEILQKTLLPII